MSNVYFITARVNKWKYEESMPGKLEELLKRIDLSKYFGKNEWIAIKTHFGSMGAHRVVRPIFLRKVVDALRDFGAHPFVTDTVRIRGLEYLEVANQNGINHLSVGAPVVIADGLYGNDNMMIDAGEILGQIAVASVLYDVSAMVVCSHVKGHINAGYAGAIKNMAMGGVSSAHRDCGWKCGRGSMHTIGEGRMEWNAELCEFCDQCVEICPLEIINFKDEKMDWDEEKCWRCGRCERGCPSGSIHFPQDDERFMSSLSEATAAVLSTFKENKVIYINFLTEIQPECDCMPAAEVPVVQDAGILISDDIVAIEQASIDILSETAVLGDSLASDAGMSEPGDVFGKLHNKPYLIQVEEAERLGLGSRNYNLIEPGK